MRYYLSMMTTVLDGFMPTVAAAVILPHLVTLFPVRGLRLILTRLDDQIYAFNSECPHASGDMSQSTISRKGRIDCPDHGYVFDIRSGRITWPEDENYCLRKYPVRVIEGVVYVKLPTSIVSSEQSTVSSEQ